MSLALKTATIGAVRELPHKLTSRFVRRCTQCHGTNLKETYRRNGQRHSEMKCLTCGHDILAFEVYDMRADKVIAKIILSQEPGGLHWDELWFREQVDSVGRLSGRSEEGFGKVLRNFVGMLK